MRQCGRQGAFRRAKCLPIEGIMSCERAVFADLDCVRRQAVSVDPPSQTSALNNHLVSQICFRQNRRVVVGGSHTSIRVVSRP